MAIRAWMDGDLRLALRLLQWAQPESTQSGSSTSPIEPSINNQDDSDWMLQVA